MKLLVKLSILYIYVLVFTNVLAITPFVALPTFVSFLIALVFLYKLFCKDILIPTGRISFLFLFWVVLTFSFIINTRGSKSLNHYILWSYAFFIFYYIIKIVFLYLLKNKDNFLNILFKALAGSVLGACLFGIIEFVLINFIGVDLNAVIPRGTVETYTPLALGYVRARSFMEESGHFIFFLETLSPIAIGWVCTYYKSKILKISYILCVTLSMFLAFSAYGFVAILLAILIVCYYYLFYTGSIQTISLRAVKLIGILFLFGFILMDVFEVAYQLVSIKLDGSSSMEDRSGRVENIGPYLQGIHLWLGYGPAAFSSLNVSSFISLYVGILMNTGIIGLGIFILFLIKQYFLILSIRNIVMKCSFLIAFVTSVIHFCFVDLIYLAWFWLLLALVCVYITNEKKQLHD